jgi:D-alanine-D-alanine ligase
MKKNIAVIFGGRSSEHDISIITALSAVIKPLQISNQYNVVPVYIAKDGKWYSDAALANIKLFQSKAIDEFCQKSKPLALVFDDGLILQKAGLKPKRIKIDVAFTAMHGTYGEDGSLMGLLRMAGIPFVGCDMMASVIAMDKVLAKQVAQANDIPTPAFRSFTRKSFEANPEQILKDVRALHFPLFVKPAHLGSSIGISKVVKAEDLQNAIEVAAYYDDKVIVEEGVNNLIEVTVPIIGNATPEPAYAEQPLTKSEDFFDFNTKYMNGGKKTGGKQGAQGYSKIPADLPKKLYDKAVEVACATYEALGCAGIARIDLLIDSKTNEVYFNEANPLPGSLYAHNWQKKGVSNVELVLRLIQLAEERFDEEKRIQRAFATDFLKQF